MLVDEVEEVHFLDGLVQKVLVVLDALDAN
jgi:hypothetical protein